MRIFSETLNIFRNKQQIRLNEIFYSYKKESRLLSNLIRKNNCPKLFIGEHAKNNLGAFHHQAKNITISPRLLTMKQAVVDEILKHELAHYFQFIIHGSDVASHGKEFKEVCEHMGIKSQAKYNLLKENEEAKASIKEEGLLAKVEKLFALGESSNESESIAAISKANELIQKYNLQYIGKDTDEIYQEIVYVGKARNAIVGSIGIMLKKLFSVEPIWSKQGGMRTLELNGSKENLEIASYVFNYVQKEVERFYKESKKKHNLKGRTAKINYIESLINTYTKRAEENLESNNDISSDMKNEIVLHKEREYQKINNTVYGGRLRKMISSRRVCHKSRYAGAKDSSNFSINQGVNSGKGQKLIG